MDEQRNVDEVGDAHDLETRGRRRVRRPRAATRSVVVAPEVALDGGLGLVAERTVTDVVDQRRRRPPVGEVGLEVEPVDRARGR